MDTPISAQLAVIEAAGDHWKLHFGSQRMSIKKELGSQLMKGQPSQLLGTCSSTER